ncbi:hypothetical protein NIES2101_31925 [Calothrix sp. HK-06]|nr:hypothetical protein NIES2101_31925 [Calothrix sp. HK-06]
MVNKVLSKLVNFNGQAESNQQNGQIVASRQALDIIQPMGAIDMPKMQNIQTQHVVQAQITFPAGSLSIRSERTEVITFHQS